MKPCLFSVSYAGFWGQSVLSLPDFIRHAGRLGFPAVMIAGKRPHLSPLDATPELLQPVQEALAEAHVRCEALAAQCRRPRDQLALGWRQERGIAGTMGPDRGCSRVRHGRPRFALQKQRWKKSINAWLYSAGASMLAR